MYGQVVARRVVVFELTVYRHSKFDKLVAARERFNTAEEAGEVETTYRKVKKRKRRMD